MRFKQFLSEQPIKIGSRKIPENYLSMLSEFMDGTTPHPFDSSIRLWNNSVGVSIVYFDGALNLDSIMTFSDKNNGDASKALKWVTSLADKHQCVITLAVVPLKNAGSRTGKDLSKKDLISWYKRNGFEKDTGDIFKREPQ